MEQFLLPVLLIAGMGGLMYFSTKKQKRLAAATRHMQDSLVPGARVMTTSGLHATVTAVADDTIELEVSPGVRTTWVRAAVREVVVPGPVNLTKRETDVVDAELDDRMDGPADPREVGRADGSITDRPSKDLN